MFQISADLTSLTQAQREAIAGFILTFPNSEVVAKRFSELTDDELDECFQSRNAEPIVTMADPVATYVEPEEETPVFDAPLPTGVLPFTPVTGGPSQVDPPSSPMCNNSALVVAAMLDKNGLPWDERIHAGSKTKNQDGSWRYKRGVESRVVEPVEAELRAVMGLPAPVMAPLPSIPPVIPSLLIVPPPPAVPAAAAVPSITASPVVSAPTVAALNPFVSLITFAGAKNMEGKLTDAEIQAACQAFGVPAIPLMTNRHDLCPHVEHSLRLLCSTR